MLPLLRISADGQEHRLAEARGVLASEFELSDADREELLPSGRQSKFANRVAWAKVYLAQAGLLINVVLVVVEVDRDAQVPLSSMI